MQIDIQLCDERNKYILEGLLQFYYYDLDSNSKLADIHYNNGQYNKMPYFDNYWSEKNRFPYVIYKAHIPIGFALVHDITVNPVANWKIAEFFIMAPHRYQGIGKLVVESLFKKHYGLWEISVLKDNMLAMNFWKNVLGNPTILAHKEFQNFIFFEVLKSADK